VAVLPFGVSFGVLARAAGFDALAAIVFSATTFAGSAQFATVSVLGDGGTIAAAIGAAVLLNARYLAIGFTAAGALAGGWMRRLVESQLVVDETWALSNRGGGEFDRGILLGAGMLLFAAWGAGTVIGVIAGDALGDPEALGLDAAFPAVFLVLLVAQLRSRDAVAAAVAGAAIALALTPFAPPGVPIIVAVAGCLVGLRGGRRE
jgi:4-azaleucine resistance transporter AzlC